MIYLSNYLILYPFQMLRHIPTTLISGYITHLKLLSMSRSYYFLLKCSLITCFISFFSCTETEDKFRGEPIKIIFDTDMGSDCDDAGALALLHVYADMGKAEIIGCIYSSGVIPFGAGIVEAINIYYGRPEIPVGAYYKADIGDPVDKMSAEKLVKDTAAFHNSIIHNTDAEEQTRLNRRLLASAEDTSIVYLTVGHTKGLYDLLVSEPDEISSMNGFELVSKKINKWVAMGTRGAINKNNDYARDWNIMANGTAPYSKYLAENFPRPVYFSPDGTNVMTGKSLKETPPGNIVRTVYRDWLWRGKKTLDNQRASWDLIAVYFAVEGTGEFLTNLGKGWLEVDVEKGFRWHMGESQIDHTYIVQKEGTDDAFSNYLNEMIGRIPK
jgi:hypothetical protein